MTTSHKRSALRKTLVGIAVVPLLAAAACGGGGDAFDKGSGGSSGSGGSGGSGGGSVVIANQNYTEMQIMSGMYAALLTDAGYDVTVKGVDTRDLYGPQLEKGAVDVVAEYASSMTEYLNIEANGADATPVASPDIDETIAELNKLGEAKGIEALQPAEAQDANAFAVTKKYSDSSGVTTLSELGQKSGPIVLAAAPDCPDRSDCQKGLEKVYGLDITKVEPLGFGTPQTKDALKSGEVQLGQVGTSDGSLDKLGLVVLEDDQHLQNAENLVPVVNADFLQQHPDVADTLNKLSDVLTTDDLKMLNAQVDVERQLPEDVARTYLEDQGLLGG